MHAWQSVDIEVSGINLHLTRSGGAKPPLLLVHGVTDDGLCWTPVAAALAPQFDVIMPDARGHGRSDAPEHGYGSVEMAQDLSGIITELELSHPVILGHSMGAITALTLAGTYPDVPAAILLEDPPPWWRQHTHNPEEAQQGRAQMRASIAAHKRKTRDELVAEKRALAPGWSQLEIELWADAKQRFSPNILAMFDADTNTSLDWQAIFSNIKCPALLIASVPARGGLVNAESASVLQALIPQLRIEVLPEAGHSIHRDQFTRYVEVVRAFIDELSPRR